MATASRWRRTFSLRTMFVGMTPVALVFYWLAMPTFLAHRFVAVIAARDYAKAESLFVNDPDDTFGVFPGRFASNDQVRNTNISINPLTLQQILDRERFITVEVPYGKKMMEMDWSILIGATPQGLEIIFYST